MEDADSEEGFTGPARENPANMGKNTIADCLCEVFQTDKGS